MDKLDPDDVEEILNLIREDNYNLIRPSADIIPELVAVIKVLDKRTRSLR